ncbi:MAG: NAD(P)H-hydrate dehydratase [Gammaproteobacteria bacterium]|nr:NAD(P)H-hydrate dehydratase [Gammaproteobacteria bacterium]
MSALQNKLYSVAQIKILDKLAIERQYAGNGFMLMQKAAQIAWEKIAELWPNHKNFIIFCGPGNNGGDGLVIARLALEKNNQVTAVLFAEAHEQALKDVKCLKDFKNLKLITETNSPDYLNLLDVQSPTIIVDAIFGIGLSSKPTTQDSDSSFLLAIDWINKNNKNTKIFAVDIPSGLLADTGAVYKSAVHATATMTYIGLKPGLYTNDGPDYTGQLFFSDLDVTPAIYQQVDHKAWLMTEDWVNKVKAKNLPKRAKNSHKHQYGHVVIIGGNNNMIGAVLMAGTAALRAGSGLVSLVTSFNINQNQPELMVYSYHDKAENLLNLYKQATVFIIGPGLGNSKDSQSIFNRHLDLIVNNLDKIVNLKAVVIDADGLRFLADYNDYASASFKKLISLDKLVLTPHPGEARALLDNNININSDRFAAIEQIAEKYKATVILKGIGSLVFKPQQKAAVCPLGNPGMASAGMGDVLSGLVAALISQSTDSTDKSDNINNFNICCLAVYLHAKAADLQAKKYGERGLLATDLFQEFRKLLNL